MNESALKVILELGPKYGVDLWKHLQWGFAQWGHREVDWYDCERETDFNPMARIEYRVKPRTHTVNGIKCPAPMREHPEIGQEYCYIDTGYPEIAVFDLWEGHEYDYYRFGIGIFESQEDAMANFYAHFPNMTPEAE